MAKGDQSAGQNAINTFGGAANTGTNATQNQTNQQGQNYYQNYLNGTNTSLNSYDEIMNNYRNFLGGTANQQFTPQQGQPVAGSTNPANGNTGSSPGQTSQTSAQNFGNLSDPNQWTSLVGDQQKLTQWIQQNNPNMSPGDVAYYAGQIQKSPGANANEQSGGATYWLGRMQGGGTGDINNNTYGDFSGSINNALAGYQNFADTGGFTPQGIQDIRARAIAPMRSIYSSAQANVDRQRALQNGYAPNAIAAQAKMARDESQQISDANVNANAGIAQMVQQGRLAGLGGLSSTGLAGQGQNITTRGQDLNQYATLRGQDINSALTQRGQNLSGIQGMSSLYGQNPGLASTFGNQALTSGNQSLEAQQLQNSLALGLINAQQQNAKIPSDFQQGLGNIGSVLGLGGQAGSVLPSIGNLFNGSPSASAPSSGAVPGYDYGSNTNLPQQSAQPTSPYVGQVGPTPSVTSSWGVSPNDPYYGYYGPTENGQDPNGYYGPLEPGNQEEIAP